MERRSSQNLELRLTLGGYADCLKIATDQAKHLQSSDGSLVSESKIVNAGIWNCLRRGGGLFPTTVE